MLAVATMHIYVSYNTFVPVALFPEQFFFVFDSADLANVATSAQSCMVITIEFKRSALAYNFICEC